MILRMPFPTFTFSNYVQMKLRFLVVLIALVAGPCFAQKNTNTERARSLKSLPQNKKAKVVAYQNTSDYTFEMTGESLSVVKQDAIDLISLEGNLNYAMSVFYNDHIKIENYELKYASGKSLKKESVCGNYEVESIFYSDAKVCSYKFNFLYEATEVSFQSKSRYDDPRYLTKIFFHDDDPADVRQISITVPGTVNVELVEKNFAGFDIKKSVEQIGGNTVYKYSAKALPAMKGEDNSLGTLYQYPHLIVLTKDFTTPLGKKTVISSVDDLYKWYASLVKEVKNDPAPLKEEVQRLVKGVKTPEEKMKAIYYWVQDNIKYILDSTEKYVALEKNAERIQGKEMLIENGEKFIRKKVPVSDPNSNLVTRKETLSLEGETLKGQGELTLNGEAKKNILYYSTNVKQEDQKKVFDNLAVAEYSNTDKVEITNAPPVDREKPLEVKYSFTLNNKVSKFDKDLYVDLDWNKSYQNLQMEEDRVSDYYFNRKVKLKTSKKFKLPAGYRVTHLPKGMSRKNPDFSFEVSYKQIGNEVVYDNEITVYRGIVK